MNFSKIKKQIEEKHQCWKLHSDYTEMFCKVQWVDYPIVIIYGRKFGKFQLTGLASYTFYCHICCFHRKFAFCFIILFMNSSQTIAIFFLLSKSSCQLYLVFAMHQTLSSAFYCRKLVWFLQTLKTKKRAALG